jgi:oligosaccharide repeat unit polymerase
LYELKLLPYVDIIPEAWFLVSFGFFAFLMGILTITSTKNLFPEGKDNLNTEETIIKIFSDDGKAVKLTVFILSTLCLLSAIQNWYVLVKLFGSIPAVLINATLVYRLNVHRDISGVIPYVSTLGFVAIFFSGLYTAYKGKFSFLTFYPFIGIILKELAEVGRAGMLFALIEYFTSFILFGYLLKDSLSHKQKFSKKNSVIAITILLLVIIISASVVKTARGSFESYSGASKQLNKLEGNMIITPSIYLYLSSDLGVLSKYLENNSEKATFGQNTFLPIYSVLSKFDIVKRPSDYQMGYFIPMWTNTGTYIRELHADFGLWGTFLGPYLIGLITTWLWFRFYETKNLIVFSFLVFFFLIVGFSFLVMVTRLSYWFISLFLLMIFIPLVERMAVRNSHNISH